MTTRSSTPFAVRMYGLLLRAYPATFRRSYGPLMLQQFNDCYRRDRHDDGRAARLRFWTRIVADLLHSASLERIDAMRSTRWWFWPLLVLLGFAIGYVDYTATEVQATLLVLLPVAFCFGFAAPRRAWLSALIIGLAIPVTHVFGHAFNIVPPYPDYVIASLLALIPACLAAYCGAGLRWLVNAGTNRPARS